MVGTAGMTAEVFPTVVKTNEHRGHDSMTV
jgi:hypothetical protein